MIDTALSTGSIDLVIEVFCDMLPEAVPLKVNAHVPAETSMAEDLDFDSRDTVNLLNLVNARFNISLDFEPWLIEESQRDDTPHTVKSLCDFIAQTIEAQ